MKSFIVSSTVVLTLIGIAQTSFAEEVTQEKAVIETVKPPAPPKYHGKTLFKYPSDHVATIVTYTKDDLEKVRQERLMRDLTSLSKKSRNPAQN